MRGRVRISEGSERIPGTQYFGDRHGFRWQHLSRRLHRSLQRRDLCTSRFSEKVEKGIATPKQTIELIKSRLHDAESDYRARQKQGEWKS
jgi:hypothetical protein